jgi:PAS domain-containing protein
MTTITKQRLAELVSRDKSLAAEATNAALALMEHRWTAVQEVGNKSEYARALGVDESVIRKYVRGWEAWQGSDASVRTPDEVLELAGMNEQKRAAVEAVADAKGIGVRAVRQGHMADVREVERTMREEPNLEESIAKGRRTAQSIETVRRAEATKRQEQRRKTPAAYLDIDNHLSRANRALTEALGIARDEHFDTEYVDMIRSALDRTRTVLDLIQSALTGDTKVDWDTELRKLQEAGE